MCNVAVNFTKHTQMMLTGMRVVLYVYVGDPFSFVQVVTYRVCCSIVMLFLLSFCVMKGLNPVFVHKGR
jgi:hypothetical protein